jgi:hypothetical protein
LFFCAPAGGDCSIRRGGALFRVAVSFTPGLFAVRFAQRRLTAQGLFAVDPLQLAIEREKVGTAFSLLRKFNLAIG